MTDGNVIITGEQATQPTGATTTALSTEHSAPAPTAVTTAGFPLFAYSMMISCISNCWIT